MNTVDKINEELVDLYKNWHDQAQILTITKSSVKTFFDDDDNEADPYSFSNPFYVKVPDDWICEKCKYKIMIVGEEGYGDWNRWQGMKSTSYQELQEQNLSYINGTRQCRDANGNMIPYNYTSNKSPFWTRFKQIEYLNPTLRIQDISDGMAKETAVVWSNCDKICRAGSHGRLSTRERRQLHSIDMDVLMEEVKILEPTHIVFLGWYSESLGFNKKDSAIKNPHFPKYGTPNGKGRYKYTMKTKSFSLPNGKMVNVYYLYHPSYGMRHKKKYDAEIEEVIKSITTSSTL